MKSTPRATSISTARRPSSGVVMAIDAGNWVFGPSSIGPATTIRGPRSFPAAMSARACRTSSRLLPMSRTPVIPLATNSGRVTSRPAGACSPKKVWTCMSHRPGIRNFPAPSTTCAPGGIFTWLPGPTFAMRSPSTTTFMSGSAWPFTTSITVTCAMTKADCLALATEPDVAAEVGACADRNEKFDAANKTAIRTLTVAIDRHRPALHQLRLVATQKQNYPRDVFGFRPLAEVRLGHRVAIGLGVDDAGQHRIGAHPSALQVRGEAIDHRPRRSLRRSIRRGARRMVYRRFGCDIHDRSRALFQHLRQHRARQDKSRTQIQREHLVPHFRVEFPQLRAARVTTDRIYQGVEPSVLRHNLCDGRAHHSLIRYFGGVTFQIFSGRARRALQRVKPRRLSVVHGYRGAFGQKRQTDGASQPASAAGHQNHFARKFFRHCPSSRLLLVPQFSSTIF